MPSSDRASARTRAAACSSSSTSSSGSSGAPARVSRSSLTSEPLPVVLEVDVPGLLADADARAVQQDHGHLVELVAVIRAEVRELRQGERRLRRGVRVVVFDVAMVGASSGGLAELVAV